MKSYIYDRTFKKTVSSDENLLKKYINEISRFELLSKEDEMEIGKRIFSLKQQIKDLKNNSDKSKLTNEDIQLCSQEIVFLRQKMTNSNLRLVVSIAKRYVNRGLGLIDLISEGNIGLIEAVDHYDFSKGCKFSTYGTWWIKQAIMKAISNKSRSIRLPDHINQKLIKYNTAKNYAFEKKQRTPNISEISEIMNMETEQLKLILMHTQNTRSLDDLVDDDSTLMDIIPDINSPQPFENANYQNLSRIISRELNQLTEREMSIILCRFGFNGNGCMTLEETGRELGLTRERVRQIQVVALNKLRKKKSIKDFEKFY